MQLSSTGIRLLAPITIIVMIIGPGCASSSGNKQALVGRGPLRLDQIECEAWAQTNSTPRGRVPLSKAKDQGQDSYVGRTQGDAVRFLATVEKGKIYLAIHHREKDSAVAHAFEPQDPNLALSLSVNQLRADSKPDVYDLSCKVVRPTAAYFDM